MKRPWVRIVLRAVVLLLTHSSVGTGLQLSELRDGVRLRVRDTNTDTTHQQFTDADINEVINEGHRVVVGSLWPLRQTYTFSLTKSVRYYVLPTDLIVVTRVNLANKPLPEVTKQGLDADYDNWSVASATPTVYFIDKASSTGQSLIGFYPIPSTTSTNSCFVEYAQIPYELTADTSVPYNGRTELYPYHDLLMDYAAGNLWMMQGIPDLGKPFLEMYGMKVANFKSNLSQMPNFNPSIRGDRGSGR